MNLCKEATVPATKQEYEAAKNALARLNDALEDLFKRIEPGLAPSVPTPTGGKEQIQGKAPISETAANFAQLGEIASEMTEKVRRVTNLCDL